jgi:beta-fructofuranosidase
VQSLPRELELPEDGVLRIKPLRELQSLRYDEKVEKKMTVVADQEARLETLTGDAIELEITFAAPLPKEFGVKLLGDEKGENSMSIVAGAGMKKLMVGNLDPEFALKKYEDLTLRIFIDKNLVEVFASDRQAAAYAHRHFPENPNVSLFTKDSDLVVKQVKSWKMKSIYVPAE